MEKIIFEMALAIPWLAETTGKDLQGPGRDHMCKGPEPLWRTSPSLWGWDAIVTLCLETHGHGTLRGSWV